MNKVVGYLLYYWIFILGFAFVARFVLGITDGTTFIVLILGASVIYWAVMFIKGRKSNE